MALEIGGPTVYRDWFRDDTQIPGWVVEWQMGRGRGGVPVVSALRVYLKQGGPPVFGDDVLPGTPAWSKFWRAWGRHKEPPIPGSGITSELLRKVRLGTARLSGAAAVRQADKKAAPAKRKPVSARRSAGPGRKPRYTSKWWLDMGARYLQLRAERPHDYAKVLGDELGLKRDNMRGKIWELNHSQSLRAIRAQLKLPVEYQPPPTAARVCATGVQQTRRRP